MPHPYKKCQDYQFWRRSVSNIETFRFDPVEKTKFKISKTAKVSTAGSCFAQHISHEIKTIGFNYFVTEAGDNFDQETKKRHNYGVFSARYGNLYTTAQLKQLFDEAFGTRIPTEQYWVRPDGRYIDPFRQQVEPEGFETIDDLLADRAQHLEAVRRMFLESDFFVFTLGLTEAWRSKEDGSVFPTAPGVIAGEFSDAKYEFVNFSVSEVYNDMDFFLKNLKKVNPNIKVVLTVSPVPLMATYEDKNVLVATTYSKAVLRVVADMIEKQADWIDYFPAYEIITGSFSGGLYYEPDYRQVNHLGVAHAMRCFLNNYIEKIQIPTEKEIPFNSDSLKSSNIICDEEVMNTIRT
ncbi:MAG: GSCFA domain-containing protein [Zymomonas mobilis subsp. pomaceae]|uniref:GSCFA domain-containing protein n=1 Tax=Zymomonas mobilis TaxID=542 RepID=UPI0039E9992B